MLSYMLPTEDKPPPGGEPNQNNYRQNNKTQKSTPKEQQQTSLGRKSVASVITTSSSLSSSSHHHPYLSPTKFAADANNVNNRTTTTTTATKQTTMIVPTTIEDQQDRQRLKLPGSSVADQNATQMQQQHCYHQGVVVHTNSLESPKYNGTVIKKSTLHNSRVTKDDSLYSIDSDASTVGSDRKNKILNGAKHASLKRVSFGSSKGSMVETLVYETPVQEEPEINHFMDHNGRLPPPMIPVPDTDEGREKVRVSLLGPQPAPATPGVLLLEPLPPQLGLPLEMAANSAELLTTHSDHTAPAYHAQISTDSGWDNPFRPDGDLSREADEIVELIKGGKPITPTPGQTAPPLPGCEDTGKTPSGVDHDSSSSPLLKSNANSTNMNSTSSPRLNQGNGNAHGTQMNSNASGQMTANNEKGGPTSRTTTVEVARMTAQGPGDASQVEHVTLKKKPKCKCCVLQ